MSLFDKEYKSWYDLSYEKSCELEQEFISHDMGKYANQAMHIQVMIGIITFVVSAILLALLLYSSVLSIYMFVILIMFIVLGMVIIVASTIEYHMKFNSWLKVTKRIIKK